jgi:hypothetical protein
VPIAADGFDREIAPNQIAGSVLAVAVLHFKAPGAPLIATPNTGIEAVVEACDGQGRSADRIRLIK